MAMKYEHVAIPDHEIPVAVEPLMQHALQTYASETNKVVSVWSLFSDEDLAFCPHPRASTIGDILKHQLLSERRFFGEFIGSPEPPAPEVLPTPFTVRCASTRIAVLARPRLAFLASKPSEWWTTHV